MSLDDIDVRGLEKDAGDIGEILVETGKRLVSVVVGMQAGPVAGAAVGAALAAAYLIYRRKKRLASKGLTVEEANIINLRIKIDRLYQRREELEQAISAAKRPSQRRMLMDALRNTDSMIRDLEDILELYNTLLEARRRIETLLGPKAAREVDKILQRVEKGEEPGEQVYKLLQKVEDKIDKTETGIANLKLILGGP
ncbi:MAG: hypothetical protein GSR77_01770 [Desulfurococcales archaeon]|nr:hypothetical protein [Desulfurococcales archaeon]